MRSASSATTRFRWPSRSSTARSPDPRLSRAWRRARRPAGRLDLLGPTPCTLGTFDLYWMAVDPAAQGAGIGTALIRAMEDRLRGLARLIIVETAGRADYRPTRAFYEARGYQRAAVIPDFYAPGDDQLVYVKTLATG